MGKQLFNEVAIKLDQALSIKPNAVSLVVIAIGNHWISLAIDPFLNKYRYFESVGPAVPANIKNALEKYFNVNQENFPPLLKTIFNENYDNQAKSVTYQKDENYCGLWTLKFAQKISQKNNDIDQEGFSIASLRDKVRENCTKKLIDDFILNISMGDNNVEKSINYKSRTEYEFSSLEVIAIGKEMIISAD